MTPLTLQEALDIGFTQFKAGRLPEAEAIFRQILAEHPDQPDALHRLGLIALQVGRVAVAIELIQRAIQIQPDSAKYHFALGRALLAQGDLQQSMAGFARAVALQPVFPEAHNDLGNSWLAAGRLDEAIAEFRIALAQSPDFFAAMNNLAGALVKKGQPVQAAEMARAALAIEPNSPQVHYTLGEALFAAGEFLQSLPHFRKAIELQPVFFEAYINLGNALMKTAQVDAAIEAFVIAANQRPESPAAYCNLCNALQRRGQFQEAIECARQAIHLDPRCFEAYINLGNALIQFDLLNEAVETFTSAVNLAPRSPEAHSNLGNALFRRGQPVESLPFFRTALQLWPDYHEARLNLALALLTQGDLENGWKEYEIRRLSPGLLRADITQPQWDGSPLQGRRILLHAEQGIGDTLQFVRYLPLVRERGGKIILQCQAPAQPLLQTLPGIEQCIAHNQPLPEYDVHCSLLSLPLIFGTTLETIPAGSKYLSADPIKSQRWRERLNAIPGFKVGLVWAGAAEHYNDRNRSMPLSALAPLAAIEGVSFISLQKGPAGAQSPGPLQLIDWTAELNDFSDTAALIDGLDLVISVDTSVPHLAAAMGKPVWMLLARVADWRWLTDREDSPWYPTLRLFRQETPGDWKPPVTRIAQSLREATASLPNKDRC